MSQQIRTEDGVIHSFPDEATPDEIGKALKGQEMSAKLKASLIKNNGMGDPTGKAVTSVSKPGFFQSLPGIGGAMIGAVPGAEAGAAIGAFGGPLAPATIPLGGLIGGVAGAYFGGRAGETARQLAESAYRGNTEPLNSARVAEEGKANAIGEGIGRPVGAIAGAATKAIAPKVGAATTAAAKFAADNGIPIDRAVQTGSMAWNAARGLVERLPIVGRQSAAFREGTGEGLQNTFKGIADQAGEFGSKSDIGQSVTRAVGEMSNVDAAFQANELTKKLDAVSGIGPRATTEQIGTLASQARTARAAQLNSEADTAYTKLREIAGRPEHAATIETGSTPMWGTHGEAVPTSETIQSPVSTASVKAALAPLYESVAGRSGLAQQQATPAMQVLHGIMNMPDQIPLDRALSELSALKAAARSPFPEMRSIGQGVSAKVVPLFHEAVDSTVGQLGPEATAAWQTGRKAVTDKYALIDTKIARKAAGMAEGGAIESAVKNPVALQSLLDQTGGSIRSSLAQKVVNDMISGASRNGELDQAAFRRAWNGMPDDIKGKLFQAPERQALARLADPVKSNLADSVLKMARDQKPEALVDTLLRNGDSAVSQLKAVKSIAPEEMPRLARSYLEGIIDSASTNGFRATEANMWKKLGPETKAVLYTPETIKQMDQFFDLVRRLGAQSNPSGTAGTLMALGPTGILLGPQLVKQIATGDFQGAGNTAVEGAAGIGGTLLTGKILAHMLYSSPVAAQALRTGLLMKASEPATKNVARVLAIEYMKARDEASREAQ